MYRRLGEQIYRESVIEAIYPTYKSDEVVKLATGEIARAEGLVLLDTKPA